MNIKTFSGYKKALVHFMRVVWALTFVLGIAGFPQKPNRVLAQSPHIVASITYNWFRAVDFPTGAELTFTIYATEDLGQPWLWQGMRTADDTGYIHVGEWEHPIDLEPGNTLVVSDGVTEKVLTLEAVSLDVFDPEGDYLAGTAPLAPEGRQVWVGTGNESYGCSMDVTANPSTGAWEADFTTQSCDVTEDMWAAAQVYDADGDASEANPPPPPPNPWMIAFPENEAVEGWEWPEGSTVYLTIDNAPPEMSWEGTAEVTTWGDPRTYVRFEFGGDYDLQIGDVVTLTDNNTWRSHQVQNLSVSAVDSSTETVAGEADPDALVSVWPHGYDQIATVQVNAGEYGSWVADFNGLFDLSLGTGGRSQIQDVNGNATAVDWDIPWPEPWRDEFDQEPAEPWYWVNPNPNRWGLNDGNLRIYASPSATGGENLLLRPVENGDFTIKTHLFFEPDANFQFAGLVIYQDADNYLQFGRAFCDAPDACVGNGIYFDKALDGEFRDSNFGTQVGSSSEAYLRLERRGDMVKAFYSSEGITWFEIGTHWIPEGFQVNGVGLTASQDYSTPEEDIPADFDFFELTDGWGFLPEGSHGHDAGDVPHWACNAGGWTVDPDNREIDLWVELAVDGETLPDWLPANIYRDDLEADGSCVGGTCGFHTSLWDVISHYESHSVAAYAQDIPSGEWVLLPDSPKPLTCRTYDIYIYDTFTGETRQLTDLRDSWEFNPRWSPDGMRIVHDRWSLDFSDNLGVHITRVDTGESRPLAGAENGSYPAWSPNGLWIAFDRGGVEDYRLYIVPPTGGEPKLVREDAFMASWAPNSLRLAFNQPSDGSIWTTDLKGGNAIKVAERGSGPAWSPNGLWIAYEMDGDLWKVRVDPRGRPLGAPIQLTNEAAWEGRPSWSVDSRTIVFHKGFDRDTDLWTIPAAGGTATWLTGAPGFADYDPNYSNNGRYVAYSSFSPAGQAARSWVSAYTYDLPTGTLEEGTYPYHFEFEWSSPEPGEFSGQGGEFVVSSEADGYDGYVLLRGFVEQRGVDTTEGLVCEEVEAINPSQPARFLIGWLTDREMTYPEAQAHFDSITSRVVWGEDMSAGLLGHEILPFYSVSDWFQYVCTYTRPKPMLALQAEWSDSATTVYLPVLVSKSP
jgi:Tol biopolymer transport system component/regulation of enolase protein 1 (concanavalin A-like superfamily)